MNRLIIIGNGFDLAHGLPTSYSSFLNYIWKNFEKAKSNGIFQSLFEANFDHFLPSYSNFTFFLEEAKKFNSQYRIEKTDIYGLPNYTIYHNNKIVFKFNNKFFELINKVNAINWVDIENVYYKVLISLVNKDNKYRQVSSIEQLNEEFNEIKILLQHYLENEVENNFVFDNNIDKARPIIDLLKYNYKALINNQTHKFFLEFPADYRKELLDFDELFHPYHKGQFIDGAFENLFLDFNYTSNVRNYVNILNKENVNDFGRAAHIQIHGNFIDPTNKLNFGFGDEMDDNYKTIESAGDNNYLENIKSFMYLNNGNYKNLLNWIESQDFQVFIMGHSCGLSDRTLLNTIFEHHNCKSIKIFYYEKSPGDDNFTEISQNLSRHFNKKALMRSKVVNKELSVPLPQDVRYRKNYYKGISI